MPYSQIIYYRKALTKSSFVTLKVSSPLIQNQSITSQARQMRILMKFMKRNKNLRIGITALFEDEARSFTPENLSRMKRREAYETNPEHDTLKNKREKRDELKEKKYQAQLKKEQTVKEEK